MSFDTAQNKIPTVSQALAKAQRYCAYQERYQQEARDKLYQWGLHSRDVEMIIAELITSDFINEERYAKTFAGGKFRIKKWGRVKIRIELKKRKISDYCIRKAIEEIDDEAYLAVLTALIHKKSREVKEKNQEVKKYKVARFVISKGFESELVWDVMNEL